MVESKNGNTLERRIANLEKQVCKLAASTGGMLSIVDLRDRIVKLDKVDEYLRLFEKRDWPGIKQIGEESERYEKKFVFTEYNQLNLTPFSYDLSVGHQLFSIQRASAGVVSITDERPYLLQPGETVVVITRELIAIPPYYSATVWPRFNMVRSGIFQSMVKVDPTWYGKLAVAMSNLSPTTLEIRRGMAFGTFLLYELSQPADVDLWKEKDLEEVDLALDDEVRPLCGKLDKFVFENQTLQGHCRLKDNILKIKGIKRREVEELKRFDKSTVWQEFAEKIGLKWVEAKHSKTKRRMIGMEALGMNDLEPILRGAARGAAVTVESVRSLTVTPEALCEMAIEYGQPFDIVAAIPKSVLERVEKEVVPHMEAEVGAKLFPQIVQLTLRVLALLSLISVLVALGGKFFELKVTWLGIVVTFVILGMFVIMIWTLRNFPPRSGKDSPEAKRPPPLIPQEKVVEIEKEYRLPKFVNLLFRLIFRLKR